MLKCDAGGTTQEKRNTKKNSFTRVYKNNNPVRNVHIPFESDTHRKYSD